VDRAVHEPYVAGLKDAGHDPGLARMKGPLLGYVTEDPERDWPAMAPHVAYWLESYARYGAEGMNLPPRPPTDPDRLRSRGLSANQRGLGVGTPEDIACQTHDLIDGLPVESIFFWASFAGMPEESVMTHIQIICTRLIPLLDDAPRRSAHV
jgi:hypothetical protein